MNDRNLDYKWILNSLLNEKPQGILKQDLNKFKLHYNHPTKKGYDLIIIIAIINSPENIIKVTTYEQNVKRRL